MAPPQGRPTTHTHCSTRMGGPQPAGPRMAAACAREHAESNAPAKMSASQLYATIRGKWSRRRGVYKCPHTHTHTHTHTYARTHTHTHTHTRARAQRETQLATNEYKVRRSPRTPLLAGRGALMSDAVANTGGHPGSKTPARASRSAIQLCALICAR